MFLSLALFVTSAAGFAYMDLQGQITRINIDRYLDGSVTRTDAIGDSYDGHALNILVLGTDTRSGANNVDGSDGSDDTAVARSDTAMIMHVSADRSRVEVVSIPRDLLVDIPKCKTYDDTESAPQSDTMFNNAFATGAGTGTDATALAIGAACSINTVEKMTGVNIDEFMVVDFHGLETMVDALGGVNLYVSEEIDDPDYTQLHLSVGCQHLNGTDGLKYARARHGYGNGSDIGRIQHQQNLMGAMIRTAQSKNILSNANELYSFARTALGALTTLGWVLVPLLLTGVDSTLDPRALTPWIAPSRSLSAGLAVAGAAGVPGIATGVCLALPALAWAAGGHWGAAGLALLLAPAALATCVLVSRVVVIGTGVSTTRRGRDIIGAIGGVAVIGAAVVPSLFNAVAMRSEGLDDSLLMAIARVLSLSPFGWALAAPGYLAQGRAGAALSLAVGALALPIALAPLWGGVVRRVMSGDRASGRRKRCEGDADVPAPADAVRTVQPTLSGATTSAPLVWQRRLERVIPPPAAAIAARCLRYWRTDPRYLALGASAVFVALAVGVVMVLNTQQGFGGAEGDSSLASAPVSAASGGAPPALLGVPVVIALMSGWALHDDLGYDSTALWMHLSAGVRGRDDRLGRVAAAALWQLPVLAVVTLALGVWTGRWDIVPAVVGAQLGLYGAAAAWSSVMSAVLPYEVNAPGESPLRSRSSGMILVASLVQTVGLAVIAGLALPVAVGLGALMATGAWQWGWALLAGGALWGAGRARCPLHRSRRRMTRR